MYFLVLEDDLLTEFYKFKFNLVPNQNIIFNLLNKYKRHLTNVAQISRIETNFNNSFFFQRLKSQLANQRYINQSLIDLRNHTALKIILSNNRNNYPYVNINQDEFESNFTATYSANANKQKVLDHIKDLCQSVDNIEIYDKYLFHNNGNINDVDDNHFSVKIINEIISCCNNQDITLYYKNKGKDSIETNNIQQRIDNFKNYSNLHYITNNISDHDRYIRIKKNGNLIYEIVLSSGIYNILGNKDFTYVVRTFQ